MFEENAKRYEFRRLVENRRYEFWITASTAIGEGQSSIKVMRTLSSKGKVIRALASRLRAAIFELEFCFSAAENIRFFANRRRHREYAAHVGMQRGRNAETGARVEKIQRFWFTARREVSETVIVKLRARLRPNLKL